MFTVLSFDMLSRMASYLLTSLHIRVCLGVSIVHRVIGVFHHVLRLAGLSSNIAFGYVRCANIEHWKKKCRSVACVHFVIRHELNSLRTITITCTRHTFFSFQLHKQ
jgi:hypothetical protein